MVQAMDLQVGPQSPARRLFATPETRTGAATLHESPPDSLTPPTLQAVRTGVQAHEASKLETAIEVLAAAIQDITC